jgi:hypothetical protein
MNKILTLHAIVPLFFVFLPYLTRPLSLAGLFQLSAEIRTISLLLLNISTILNNALTIYTVRPYRNYIVQTIKRIFWKQNSTIQVMSLSKYNHFAG